MREVESLISRSERYLKSAELLLDSGDFESSVSRTYYAMYYSVEALLLKDGLSFSSHKAVISSFGERFVKTGKLPRELGRQLNLAFQKRQLSDYEHDFVISRDEASELLSTGRAFVEKIVELLK